MSSLTKRLEERGLISRAKSRVTKMGLVDAGIIFVIIMVILIALHPNLLLSSSMITGGDTGSHFALPAYLKSQGDIFNLTPWYPGWFDGMPAYSYYFVLPDYLAVLGSYIINFAVAFKLATILGSVLMPITAYAMGRLFKAPRPIPVALALATLPFLFDASFTIDGGNLFSTMAGEYAFSLSLAFALLTIGLFARGVRTGKGYWLAAVGLAATLAAHVLPWFFTIEAVVVLVIFEVVHRSWLLKPDGENAGGEDEITKKSRSMSTPWKFGIGAGLLGGALSAWWLLPFVTTQNMTNSMGYQNIGVSWHPLLTTMGWFNSTGGAGGDRWVILIGIVACAVAFWVRDRLGMVLATLTILSVFFYAIDPQSVIWNERLIPFWFITSHLVVGWLFGYGLSRWATRTAREKGERRVSMDNLSLNLWGVHVNYDASKDRVKKTSAVGSKRSMTQQMGTGESALSRGARRTMTATVIVAILGLLTTVPGQITPVANALGLSTSGNQVSSWAAWNYSGYQSKPAWPEFNSIISMYKKTTAKYGCGRSMWEYNSNENRWGTPEALMTLPYWTDNCVDSMEGLLFESSATTPYHFLNQAELSDSPSDPEVGLAYGGVNVPEGIKHLQMLGVKYYLAYSPDIIKAANADKSLKLVATTKSWTSVGGEKWYLYYIKNSPVVQPLRRLPNVVSGISSRVGWLNANTSWWLDPSEWGVLGAVSGPSTWPKASTISTMKSTKVLPKVTVSDVQQGNSSISFHVSKVGIPILVKISYFPQWHVTGGTGPYRVSPNLMVVVPTSKDVELTYGSTPALFLGSLISWIAVLAGLVMLWRVKISRKMRKGRGAPGPLGKKLQEKFGAAKVRPQESAPE
jgi:hypothetical protein